MTSTRTLSRSLPVRMCVNIPFRHTFFSYLCKRGSIKGQSKDKKKSSTHLEWGFSSYVLIILISYFLNFLISSLQYLLAANDIDALLHLAQTLTSKIVYGSLILHY